MRKLLAFTIAGLGLLVLGAAAQYTYERKIDTKVTITAERAGTYLSLLRTDKAWPAKVPLGALYHCDLWILAEGESARLECHGKETGTKVPADSLPKGATVDEVHN